MSALCDYASTLIDPLTLGWLSLLAVPASIAMSVRLRRAAGRGE
jgi:hypothetical protein